MVSQSRLVVVIGALVAGLAMLPVFTSNANDDTKPAAKAADKPNPSGKKIALKAFMRHKLTSSQSIIEGLALEDFELIARGAKELKATSAAAQFMVVDDPLYKEHAAEFRRTVAKLEKATNEKRIDGATLGFVDMTMSCVECHKYVRTILVAQLPTALPKQ